MNAELRQRLVEVAKAPRTREIITFLYRDHPQGASFEESQLTQLVEHDILTFDDATMLMDGFLR